ncbi:MAG: serine hydrolase [Bacteroidota bacterium]
MRILLLSFSVLLLLSLQACLSIEPLKLEKQFTPKASDDGWAISTPAAEGFDPAKLEEAYDLFFSETEGFRTAISLLVIRNGKIVAEGYCRNADDDQRLNNIKSATKSVTAILFGIAMQNGVLDTSLTATLSDYWPAYAQRYPDKSNISLQNILTMQSGIAYSNQINTGELLVDKPASSIDYILSQPLAFEQGSQFDYHDGNSHLMGAILQTQTGQTLSDYAQTQLFAPLQIDQFEWERHPDGLNYGAFGLYLTPRDFARFGQLILNEGVWNGEVIVDHNWIKKSVTPYSNLDDEPYGLQWWVRPEYKAFSSAGHGGQYTYIIPDKDLLIVYTAEPTVVYHEYGTDFADFEKIVKLVLEALE